MICQFIRHSHRHPSTHNHSSNKRQERKTESSLQSSWFDFVYSPSFVVKYSKHASNASSHTHTHTSINRKAFVRSKEQQNHEELSSNKRNGWWGWIYLNSFRCWGSWIIPNDWKIPRVASRASQPYGKDKSTRRRSFCCLLALIEHIKGNENQPNLIHFTSSVTNDNRRRAHPTDDI